MKVKLAQCANIPVAAGSASYSSNRIRIDSKFVADSSDIRLAAAALLRQCEFEKTDDATWIREWAANTVHFAD